MHFHIWNGVLNKNTLSIMSIMATIKEQSCEFDVFSLGQDLCSSPPSVIVIGGGFAGLAAANALHNACFKVRSYYNIRVCSSLLSTLDGW